MTALTTLAVLAVIFAVALAVADFRIAKQRDEALAKCDELRKALGDAQFDLAAAKHLAEMAQPTWEAVSEARKQLASADKRLSNERANLRQRLYTQKLMLQQFLDYLPPSQRASATALIDAPMPELENIQTTEHIQ